MSVGYASSPATYLAAYPSVPPAGAGVCVAVCWPLPTTVNPLRLQTLLLTVCKVYQMPIEEQPLCIHIPSMSQPIRPLSSIPTGEREGMNVLPEEGTYLQFALVYFQAEQALKKFLIAQALSPLNYYDSKTSSYRLRFSWYPPPSPPLHSLTSSLISPAILYCGFSGLFSPLCDYPTDRRVEKLYNDAEENAIRRMQMEVEKGLLEDIKIDENWKHLFAPQLQRSFSQEIKDIFARKECGIPDHYQGYSGYNGAPTGRTDISRGMRDREHRDWDRDRDRERDRERERERDREDDRARDRDGDRRTDGRDRGYGWLGVGADRTDWICSKCNIMNFSTRLRCFRCSKPRERSDQAIPSAPRSSHGSMPSSSSSSSSAPGAYEAAFEYAHALVNRCIVVKSLSYDVDDEMLADHFRRKGVSVSLVRVLREKDTGKSKRVAFLCVDETENREDAVRRMNGTLLDGRELLLECARGGMRMPFLEKQVRELKEKEEEKRRQGVGVRMTYGMEENANTIQMQNTLPNTGMSTSGPAAAHSLPNPPRRFEKANSANDMVAVIDAETAAAERAALEENPLVDLYEHGNDTSHSDSAHPDVSKMNSYAKSANGHSAAKSDELYEP